MDEQKVYAEKFSTHLLWLWLIVHPSLSLVGRLSCLTVDRTRCIASCKTVSLLFSVDEGAGMNPEPSSRHGWTQHDQVEQKSSHPFYRSSRRTWLRSIGYALIVSLVILLDVFGNMPVVAAASHSTPTLPIPNASYTLQQFLKQGKPYQAKDAPLPLAGGKPTPPRGTSLPTKTTQPKPSVEPAKMKAVSQPLASSSANTTSTTTASATSTPPSTPVRVVGSDADGVRLEVVIPAGAIDASKATTSKGTAPQGTLTIKVSQLSGHSVGMNTSLGTFQIQITDATGATVNGITLRSPATFILHYRKKELQKLDLEPKQMVMAWPTLTGSKDAATAKSAVIAMTNNTAASTLTAQSSILDSAAVTIGISDPMNQAPQKPHMATTGGNTGQLNYSYPFVVAPGPPGTAPTLAANYSSAATNGRHSPTAPADNMGEGWSLSMPSITTQVEGGGSVWYSINGLAGVSDRLIPDSATVGNGTSFATEHLSYLKIQMADAGFDSQSCFHVWDTASNYYEFGCTHDSMQYYTDSNNNRTNYRFDISKFMPAHDGNTSRVVTYKYVQLSNTDSGYYTIRDAALVQIVYGTSTTTAGIVDLFYKGPSDQSVGSTQFVTAYGNNEGGCTPPDGKTTTKRCDDLEDKDGGLPNAWVLSVLSLSTIKTYVGDDSSISHLDYSYAFSYTDTSYYNCKDAQSGTNEYCAGNHLLTSITPTVYQNGTGHALPGVTFGYSNDGDRLNKYEDSSQSVPAGGNYKVQTNWRYLTSYHDHSNGTGASIVWHTAYNNSHGTPYSSSDQDNRYDTFYCVWHSGDCSSGNSFYPYYDKMWTEQVVYQITQIGTDSSASGLTPQPTTYHYWLTKTTGSCPADSQSNSDCVGFGWIPDSSDGWQDYYHGDFRGFGTVLITSPSGNLTVQKYYATEGWDSSEGDAGNYLAGSMYEEDVYSGGSIDGSKLLKQTLNTYAGTNSTHTSCSSAYVAGLYKPCEVIPLTSKTTIYEQTNSAGPWMQTSDTWDDYTSSSGLISGKYHNKLSEAISGSNIATKTQKWTYQTTDTTVGSNVYYNVHTPIHSEIDDASGHVWSCSDITYDEGRASGLPSPAAGWATTIKTYSDCSDSGSAITTYTGYDSNGNIVAAVDGIASSHASLYGSAGCTLSTAPAYLASAWTAGHYTRCATYTAANAQPTDTWNALGQHTHAIYDSTQGLQLSSITDVNNLTTSVSSSYDSNGNTTTQVKEADESGSYTKQGTQKSTCTDSSTLPCLEEDGNTSLYSSAVSRTFYDSMGRAVETLTPGPDATHTTVSFTVYNDTAHTVFTSVPFVVAARTTWLDPNGATDYNGVAPGGTSVTLDPLGRTLTSTDPLSHVTTTSYGYGSSGVSGDSNIYATTTLVDANNHESKSYIDALGHTIYAVAYRGLSTGTLTAIKRITTQYNALNKSTSVTITDLAPQTGQTVTTVTTTATYDALGRVVSAVDPDRGSSTSTYDANGQLIGVTATSGANTKVRGTKYDLLGRIGCVQSTIPSATDVSVTGACSSGANPYQVNTYDTDPSGVSWTGTNYAVGHLTQSVTSTYYPAPDSATGTVTENYQYNQRGQIITKRLRMAVTGGSTIAFPTFPTYQETLAYNDADQPTTTQTSVGGATGYTFTQAYDSTTGTQIGLSNTSTASASLAALSYNAHGLLSTLTFKDSSGASLASETLLYDGALRTASATTTWTSSGSTIYSDAVSYDNVSNVLSRSTTQAAVPGVTGSGGSETQNFCYNEQNQLVWASNAVSATPATGQTCGNIALQSTLGGNYTSTYVYTHLGQIWQGPLNGTGSQEQYLL
jgi:YD repeat-containing protein